MSSKILEDATGKNQGQVTELGWGTRLEKFLKVSSFLSGGCCNTWMT